MPRGVASGSGAEGPAKADSVQAGAAPEMAPIAGRVKWFDATRGFGFLVSDQVEGDVLLHFSVLREHGRRSVPEGATIECIPVRLERGLQEEGAVDRLVFRLAAAAALGHAGR